MIKSYGSIIERNALIMESKGVQCFRIKWRGTHGTLVNKI